MSTETQATSLLNFSYFIWDGEKMLFIFWDIEGKERKERVKQKGFYMSSGYIK